MNPRKADDGRPIVCNNDIFIFSTIEKEGRLWGANTPKDFDRILISFINHQPNFRTVMRTFSSLFGMDGHETKKKLNSSILEWNFVNQNKNKIIPIMKGDRIVLNPFFYGEAKASISIEKQGITKWRSSYNDNIAFMIWKNNFREFAQIVAMFYGHKIRKAISKKPIISYSFV